MPSSPCPPGGCVCPSGLREVSRWPRGPHCCCNCWADLGRQKLQKWELGSLALPTGDFRRALTGCPSLPGLCPWLECGSGDGVVPCIYLKSGQLEGWGNCEEEILFTCVSPRQRQLCCLFPLWPLCPATAGHFMCPTQAALEPAETQDCPARPPGLRDTQPLSSCCPAASAFSSRFSRQFLRGDLTLQPGVRRGSWRERAGKAAGLPHPALSTPGPGRVRVPAPAPRGSLLPLSSALLSLLSVPGACSPPSR